MEHKKIEDLLIIIEQETPFENDTDMKNAVENILKKELKRKRKYRDTELINQCVDTLFMLDGYDVDKINSNKEILFERGLKLVYKKKRSYEQNKTMTNSLRFNPRLILIVGIIALLLTTQFIAMAFGYNPIIEIYTFFMSNTAYVTTMADEDITYTYFNESKKYDSVEELIEQEHLDIVYPTKLPDGIKLENIKKYNEQDYTTFFLTFNSDDLIWQISEGYNINIDKINNYEILNINNLTVYHNFQNNEHIFTFYHKSYEYQITFTEYDGLIAIINNLNINIIEES